MTDQMAAELEKLEKQLDLLNGDLEKKLAQLAEKLQSQRSDYASSVMMPIELLEAVFPLLVDQQRFIAGCAAAGGPGPADGGPRASMTARTIRR